MKVYEELEQEGIESPSIFRLSDLEFFEVVYAAERFPAAATEKPCLWGQVIYLKRDI